MTDLQVVFNPVLIQNLEAKLKDFVDQPWHLRVAQIIKNNWLAVAVEKGRHFEEPEAESVSQALRSEGITEIFAVATEPLKESSSCYRVAATKEGLLDFSRECAGLNFALTDEDLSFIILCTSEDYNVVAGLRRFVEVALGSDLDTARKKFRDFASDEMWDGRLLAVAEEYERSSQRQPNNLDDTF